MDLEILGSNPTLLAPGSAYLTFRSVRIIAKLRRMQNSEVQRYDSVVHMFLATCERSGDSEALVLDNRRLSYDGYLTAVQALAGELASLGVAGERVATVLPNGLDTCIASFASWMAGAQLVPLNPLYTERELREILVDASPKVLIHAQSSELDFMRLGDGAGVEHNIVAGADQRDFADAKLTDSSNSLALPQPEQLALLQYTGGTTGRAKGVDLSHAAIVANVYQRECALPTAPTGERILCAMPLFHAYGFSMGLLLAVNCAGSLIIRERYHPVDLLAQFAQHRVTLFPGAPTIYNGLVAHEQFAETSFESLHTCYSGSAPLAVDTMERWTAVTGAPIYEGYGQTEAGPILTFNQVARPIKPGTVGEVVIDTQIELVNTETNEPIHSGIGEIRARGPQLMRGYRGLETETAAALRDGWLYTGDLGEFDEDGYLIIRDRLKDMVIVGGYNVYPREIDEVLFLHAAVVDAATVGVPDDYRGEVIHAFVVVAPDLSDTTEELVAQLNRHCEQNLARYKRPVSIVLLDALPKTTVNKTDKNALRQQARQQIAANAAKHT